MNPAWSPNGDRIAFETYRDGDTDIYVMNADGSNQERLTHHLGEDASPIWSPDGSQIVFYSKRDGNAEIYVMNADGSSQKPLTNNPADDSYPVWSPDGNRIAFTTDRDGNKEIYVMDADGGSLVNLTNHDAADWLPAWSPDGTQILFSSKRDGDYEIYVMDADGRNPTRLTNNAASDYSPTWTTDGNLIIFGSDRGGKSDIYVMNADGSGQKRLTNNAFGNYSPDWKPGGTNPAPPTTTAVAATATESPTPRPLPQGGATRVWEKDNAVMVYVPAGAFWMGSTSAEIEDAVAACVAAGGSENLCRRSYGAESPRHEIYLDTFWIDRTEVTNAQYRQCVEAGICEEPTTCDWGTPTYRDGSKADHPVVCVNWDDARTYCQWAGKRLPTEAEWEKAARGTDGLLYPWGDTFDGRLVNLCDIRCELERRDEDWDDGYAETAPVGSYADGASPYGALDMAGNAWEWVSDWYDGDYYDVSPQSNPPGPNTGTDKVARGGAWDGLWTYTRAATRREHDPSDRGSIFGFRCCVAAEE